jgi:hypothetical protein
MRHGNKKYSFGGKGVRRSVADNLDTASVDAFYDLPSTIGQKGTCFASRTETRDKHGDASASANKNVPSPDKYRVKRLFDSN